MNFSILRFPFFCENEHPQLCDFRICTFQINIRHWSYINRSIWSFGHQSILHLYLTLSYKQGVYIEEWFNLLVKNSVVHGSSSFQPPWVSWQYGQIWVRFDFRGRAAAWYINRFGCVLFVLVSGSWSSVTSFWPWPVLDARLGNRLHGAATGTVPGSPAKWSP